MKRLLASFLQGMIGTIDAVMPFVTFVAVVALVLWMCFRAAAALHPVVK